VHNLVVQNSLTQTFFLQNQGLTGTDNQYNKISEESDTADHVNSDDTTNKFAPLNLESTHKWYVTNSNFFYLKKINIHKTFSLFLFSTNLYNKSLKNLIISFIS
jgi:hypothetical protein